MKEILKEVAIQLAFGILLWVLAAMAVILLVFSILGCLGLL